MRRAKLTTIAGAICAAALVACGSSGHPARADAAGGPLLDYARCMRAHAVPNFPDPSPAGGLAIPNDINPESPAFKAAQGACGKLAQGPHDAASSESAKLRLLALARCMRAHGVPSFADPSSSPPPPSSGNALGAAGWFLTVGTRSERESPAYKQAASACRLTLG
jgi:hypothetical protein